MTETEIQQKKTRVEALAQDLMGLYTFLDLKNRYELYESLSAWLLVITTLLAKDPNDEAEKTHKGKLLANAIMEIFVNEEERK